MAHAITNRCTQCGDCVPQCPKDAIKHEDGGFWIDPMLCDDCQDDAAEPQCVSICPIELPPVPLRAKKGRCKTSFRELPSLSLFMNGKSSPFASAIVVWEACNVLAQRQSLPWQVDPHGKLYYERQVNGGRGTIAFRLTNTPESDTIVALDHAAAEAEMARWDVRDACLHLIYAAHAAALEQPWEQEFVISDRQIETYLGLEKRKDLSKLARLTLIKDLVQRPCKLQLDLHWFQQGRVHSFTLKQSRLWHLLETQHHFQEDELGCKHLAGLTFRIRAGVWSKYFLNRQGARDNTAFYQYSSLPKSLLQTVFSIWQQHEGAARMMLWLLFKTKMGHEQRLTIPTLMRIAYGETRVLQASVQREERKRLLRSFESDLEVLHHYGLKPVFDPITYPREIQPLWAKLADLPDDAEAALEFWTQDGSQNHRLTDAAPRDKWHRLMQARFVCFELPEGWDAQSAQSAKKSLRKSERKEKRFQQTDRSAPDRPILSSQQIITARKRLHLSQRGLANQLGKSQSWVRDIENGRLKISFADQQRLLKMLDIKL
ncbi:helix-turn-helix domain-containing protein [Leptothermofonsia sichuanensis E412]|uniref:helix-turn-helix domain-containing protein n=1 Tax=Leptothermofonsia sichuanensis TaxID=2917832 RepID=UPI001CA67B3B|nr:helix-turn-helix domain-containing protein [Leptothermofonsia sichuanensis]QZZ18867.1 helix-turn-helix domain-containing protein [Leptothermofonsia sichuanensis E412]